MSTKACIARPYGTSWWDYYVHADGYPDHTGRVIVEMGRALGLDAVFEHAATAPQGWTHFPEEPSTYHDEPFILSPEQDGGIEWLYVLQADGRIAVYRVDGWGDPDLHRCTHLGTIDPSRPNAVAEIVALTYVETGVDAVLAGLEDQGEYPSVAPRSERLPTRKELVATPLSGSTPPETSGLNAYPAVLWPSHKQDLEFTLDSVLWIVQRMVGTLPEEEYEEPTQEEIDEWMIDMMDDGGEE